MAEKTSTAPSPTRAPGINRRNRRDQNARRSTFPWWACSASSSDVMRYPDRAKKADRVKYAPGTTPSSAW